MSGVIGLTDLISVVEAASLLPDVAPDALRRWAHAGKVPHLKMPNGRMWFRREDILALMTPVEVAPGADK